MPGLPFGAVQAHDVPQEFRSYAHIEDIEYIEIDPNKPYPRSSAYRKTADGAQMRIRNNAPEIEELDLTVDEATSFIDSLVEAGVFSWQRVYRPAQGTFVVANLEWRLEFRFDKPFAKRARSFKVEGEEVFPDSYGDVTSLLTDVPVVALGETVDEQDA